MRISDSKFLCDRCGEDCGNGGVSACLVVSDLDADNPGMVINRHYCRDREDENGKTIKGCINKLMTPANLKYALSQKEK